MDRRILMQVTGPSLVLGTLLLGACLASVWYVTRLQSNLSRVLSKNAISLEAAQELEIRARQLRFHTFLQLLDPSPTRTQAIISDHQRFEQALVMARASANTLGEQELVDRIGEEYQHYRNELAGLTAELAKAGPGANLGRLADAHPIVRVVEPCQELLRINKDAMKDAAGESNRVSEQARLAMLLLGIAGPASGAVIGYGVARGLSRSIYRLSVRVQSMAQRLDQDVGSVQVAADGDLRNLDRQLQHVVERVEEVADRLQRHQREMLRTEQLSAVGQLGASVAHEVRNPLTGIKLLVEAALRPHPSKPLSREDLLVIRGEIDRMEQTVQEFLDFARLPTPQRGVLDLRDSISQALDLVRARAQLQHVAVAYQTPRIPVNVNADRAQMHTVLVNLCLNALDAMPQGGSLEVNLEVLHGEEALVTVADTGTGIAPEMETRLFTPFASSKPTGTGLGLSISKRIILEHDGSITAANRDPTGSVFTIRLPLLTATDKRDHADLASRR